MSRQLLGGRRLVRAFGRGSLGDGRRDAIVRGSIPAAIAAQQASPRKAVTSPRTPRSAFGTRVSSHLRVPLSHGSSPLSNAAGKR
jgi:hypothetical protein